MIKIIEKTDCCGCTSCVQRCPKHCISLREDSEGFLYPQVDENACIGCGLCEKVCPILSPQDKITPVSVLAAKNRNEQERMDSSSGGVFLPLARKFIESGGVVFGAVYDEAWEVHHVYTEIIEGVYPMMGSKYLQSRIENTYQKAAYFLKQGREVMFVGSPCQIAGLRGYLRHKDFPNLLAVDFVCHGVPSPGVWRRYLAETYSREETEKQSRRQATAGKNTVLYSSLNLKSPIGDIKFRDKYESGWKKFRFVVRPKSASKADKNSVLSSAIHDTNPFMRGFLTDIYLRPSCYACKCKKGASHSDLTIADFWGIDTVAPDFDDDKGVGLVFVNTSKGNDHFSRLDMETFPSTLQVAIQHNGAFNGSTKAHPKRAKFFSLIAEGKTVEQAVAACLHIPFYRRLVTLGKSIVRRLINTVFGDAGVKAFRKILGK